MIRKNLVKLLIALVTGLTGMCVAIAADPADVGAPSANQPMNTDGTILITVFMRHDQSKTLAEINEQLWRNGYFDRFPPKGVEIVSAYVVMGIGQVTTVKLPPEKVRELNVVLEQTAWGAFRTEFYPTYDYKALGEQQRKMMQARKR
jgi:hypothetical protein